MSRIPVGATIAAAYRFVFGSFLTVLGVTWLPSVVMIVCSYVFTKMSLAAQQADPSAAASRQMLVELLPMQLVIFGMVAMMSAGVAQQALGLRTGPTRIYFSLDKPVWRLLGAYLLVALAGVLGTIVLAIGTTILSLIVGAGVYLAGLRNAITVSVLVTFDILTIYGVLFYALVRVAFLVTPITIAEGRISLRRAWAMGHRNFWRFVAVGLGVSAPIILAEGVFLFTLMPHGFLHFPPPGASPAAGAAYHQMVLAQEAAAQATTLKYWYVYYPCSLLMNTILFGLINGAQCFAYRTLTGREQIG